MNVSYRLDGKNSIDVAEGFDRNDVLGLYRDHVSSGFAALAEFMSLPVEVRSSDCYIFSETGEAYLDCGGYGVFFLGHCHPVVVEAVRTQLLAHPLSSRALLNPQLAKAAKRLAEIAPESLDSIFFTNSGAEAVELAIKLARLAGKVKVISMKNGYHGKTIGALSVTGRDVYQAPFRPLLQDVYFAEFGDQSALEDLLKLHGSNCCVILEPVQAEGGVNIPSAGYLTAVRELCNQHQSLMILDEIQTGMGRMGDWWGASHENVVPDILLAGKGLGGGVMPVAAVVSKKEVFAPLSRDPVLHSSTFAGNPLAAVAVQAAIQVIEAESLIAQAKILGNQLLTMLRGILYKTCPNLVKDVRGQGLLIGIEFHLEHHAADFMLELLGRRILTSHSLNANKVLRLTPPAVLKQSDLDFLEAGVLYAASQLQKRYG